MKRRGAWMANLAGVAIVTVAPGRADGQIAWDEERWRIEARDARVEHHEGREGLWLHDGTAWLEGASLRDGAIHFDLHAGDALGFYGVAFRASDDRTYEHFYLRPFLSGNPDASQYTPVFHGVSGWQIYAGPGYSSPVAIPTDRWIHVELRFREGRAEAFVEGERLVFPNLLGPRVAGALGLTASGAPARFANVVVSPGPPPMEATEAADSAATVPEPPGVVRRWRVSTPFAEARLDSVGALDASLVSELEWDVLDTDVRGIANLARLRERDATANTVFAAVTLRAAEPGPARVRFGFSDRVHAYLAGRPLYRADDGWRSRDYRFLGTVGLFDELVLPLEAGDNELWLAVSEDFGGWGVTLQVVESDGVEVVAPE